MRNTQKSAVFLYTNDEQVKNEIKKMIPFTVPSRRIKYLRINLTKEVRDLYTENNKKLLKKLKI